MNFDVLEGTVPDATSERPREEGRVSDRIRRKGIGPRDPVTSKAINWVENRRILEAVEEKILGLNSSNV